MMKCVNARISRCLITILITQLHFQIILELVFKLSYGSLLDRYTGEGSTIN